MSRLTVQDVFPDVGKPTYTYVARDEGVNEKRLKNCLQSPGKICVLTGPSKTGKTSLYKQVLPELRKLELVIRCSGKMTSADFWASALEALDFKRISEVSSSFGLSLSAKIGTQGEAGWSWLAKVVTNLGFDVTGKGDYALKKEVIRASIGAKDLIPLLKELPIQLVVEDFHYLADDVKKEVFQQWKVFTDEGVSVLIVSTTHHAADIAKANPDLSDRAQLLDIGQWSIADLKRIPVQGFGVLALKCTGPALEQIAKESVGLPIIAQQICQEISNSRDLTPGSRSRMQQIRVDEVKKAQDYVAGSLYANHKADYEQLVRGPREKGRKYATYEKILASFALEPLKFSLHYGELAERVTTLCSEGETIPTASINAALKALGNFQKRKRMSLLDWHDGEQRLYIIEPSFLFYLRQKIENADGGTDFTQKLIHFFEFVEKNGGQIEIKMRTPDGNSQPDLF